MNGSRRLFGWFGSFAVPLVVLTACPAVEEAEEVEEIEEVEEVEEVLPVSRNPALITAADRTCAADVECVVVSSDCCSCTSGGAATAVNAPAVAAIDLRRADVCDYPCGQAISNDETCCSLRTECVNGFCELVGFPGKSLVADCLQGNE